MRPDRVARRMALAQSIARTRAPGGVARPQIMLVRSARARVPARHHLRTALHAQPVTVLTRWLLRVYPFRPDWNHEPVDRGGDHWRGHDLNGADFASGALGSEHRAVGVSDLLYVPSLDAVDHLLAEGADPRRVHLVGNVMVEALLAHVDATRERPVIEWLGRVRGDAAS
jgi:hypothetical protein